MMEIMDISLKSISIISIKSSEFLLYSMGLLKKLNNYFFVITSYCFFISFIPLIRVKLGFRLVYLCVLCGKYS